MATAVFAASRWSFSWLLRRPPAETEGGFYPSVSAPRSGLKPHEIDTIFGRQRSVLTPAQAAAFATRSATWRCIACGKVQVFDAPVQVGEASPCSCWHFEFETDAKRRPARFASFLGLPKY